MWTDSFVTPFDWNSLGKAPGDAWTECTFWTGRNGQMCVQYSRTDSDVHYQPRTHSEYTIGVCLAGKAMKTELGQTQIMGRGEITIANPGQEYAAGYLARNGQPCEVVSFSLDRRLLADLTGELGLPPADGATVPAFIGKARASAAEDCARHIAAELRDQRPGFKTVIETQAIRLLVEAVRSWPRAHIVAVDADATPRLPRRDFVRAYEYMRWCRKEKFRLQTLCRFLGTSEERFTRLFLASTGHTPASFYNRLLLDRALGLLRQPKLSIKAIGFELGFRTSSHFIAAFRRKFAVSPQEFRRQSGPPGAGYSSVNTIAGNSRQPVKDAGNPTPRFLEPIALQPSE